MQLLPLVLAVLGFVQDEACLSKLTSLSYNTHAQPECLPAQADLLVGDYPNMIPGVPACRPLSLITHTTQAARHGPWWLLVSSGVNKRFL